MPISMGECVCVCVCVSKENKTLREREKKRQTGSNTDRSCLDLQMTSSSPILYGLDRELAEKAAGKFDAELERQAKQWIASILPPASLSLETPIQVLLKDGTVLCKQVLLSVVFCLLSHAILCCHMICRLVNAIFPEMMVKYSTLSIAFHQVRVWPDYGRDRCYCVLAGDCRDGSCVDGKHQQVSESSRKSGLSSV